MEELIKELELNEEDVNKTKRLYEEYVEENSDKEHILSLEDFTYSIYEFGLLSFGIKTDIERLIEIKKELNLDYHKEEFVLSYLNITLEDVEEEETS